MYRLLEDSGFTRVRSAVVPGCRFRKSATQDAAEAYWIQEEPGNPLPTHGTFVSEDHNVFRLPSCSRDYQ